MTERGSSHHEPYIELSGERKLIEGQNFYNQVPFAGVIQEVERESLLNRGIIRYSLSYIAKKSHEEEEMIGWDSGERLQGQLVEVKLYDLRKLIKVSLNIAPPPSSVIKNCMSATFSKLKDFPFWPDYIDYNLEKSQYRYDGDFYLGSGNRQKTRLFVPPDTYVEWLAKKIERSQRIKDAAIEVVLDETFPTVSSVIGPREILDASGKTISSRSYRIKKIAEFYPRIPARE